MRTRNVHSPFQKGFTILEIVLVMIILGILAAYAYPKFSAVSEISLSAAMDRLKSDVYYAQELARTTHTNCGIYINNTGTYTIYENGDTADPAMDPANFSNFVINLPAGITIATSAVGSKIEFDSFGVPYDGAGALAADQTITLNGVLSLQVTAETGWVHI